MHRLHTDITPKDILSFQGWSQEDEESSSQALNLSLCFLLFSPAEMITLVSLLVSFSNDYFFNLPVGGYKKNKYVKLTTLPNIKTCTWYIFCAVSQFNIASTCGNNKVEYISPIKIFHFETYICNSKVEHVSPIKVYHLATCMRAGLFIDQPICIILCITYWGFGWYIPLLWADVGEPASVGSILHDKLQQGPGQRDAKVDLLLAAP